MGATPGSARKGNVLCGARLVRGNVNPVSF